MSKRCLVIGGSGCVGSQIVTRLLEDGCRVASTYHGRPPENDVCPSFPCDLTDYAGVQQVVAQAAQTLGGLDALVGAAGVSGEAAFYQDISSPDYDRLQMTDQAAYDRCFQVYARGNFAACRAAAPFLKQSAAGNLILIGSIDGIKPVPSPPHFAASQAALKGTVESLAKELGHFQICVNLLAVGILEGGLSRQLGQPLIDAYLSHCALNRLGQPGEVAEWVSWLVTSNTYLTGQTIVLDGGL